MAVVKGLKRVIRNIRKRTNKRTQSIFKEIYVEVWNRTPVDTGALRANWNVTKGKPSVAFDSSNTSGRMKPVPVVNKDDFLYLANGAPYARRIEFEGWSRNKAPQGMLRIGIQTVVERYR